MSPALYDLSYEELMETRPDADAAIRWDPVHRITPITEPQAVRVADAETSSRGR